jgi:hypothetical protein
MQTGSTDIDAAAYSQMPSTLLNEKPVYDTISAAGS